MPEPGTLAGLQSAGVLGGTLADIAAARETARRRRLRRMALVLVVPVAWLWIRLLSGDPVGWGMPDLGPDIGLYLPAIALVLVLMAAVLAPMLGAGRSPHVLYRSSEIETSLDDVKGAGVVKDEVVRTLNLFLAYKTFKERMGGTPRKAILFEGPPGTGKTYMAKAMAREAGVPFLFVSSSAFQSMYYGQTNRKIRSYSRRCAPPPARRAGPSASSRRSTPSAPPARAWAAPPRGRASPGWSTSCSSSCRASTSRRGACGSAAR